MSVTTTGPVNLAQLAQALAAPAVLAAAGDLSQSGATIWCTNEVVTDTQIESALAMITYAPPSQETALTTLQTLLSKQSALQTQLEADIASVTQTGWANLTAAEQQAIIGRILSDGLGSAMQAIVAHLTVDGIN